MATDTRLQGEALLLSTEDAAALLGIGKSFLYDLINADELESIKVGKRRLIPRSACEEYVERRRRERRSA